MNRRGFFGVLATAAVGPRKVRLQDCDHVMHEVGRGPDGRIHFQCACGCCGGTGGSRSVPGAQFQEVRSIASYSPELLEALGS